MVDNIDTKQLVTFSPGLEETGGTITNVLDAERS